MRATRTDSIPAGNGRTRVQRPLAPRSLAAIRKGSCFPQGANSMATASTLEITGTAGQARLTPISIPVELKVEFDCTSKLDRTAFLPECLARYKARSAD